MAGYGWDEYDARNGGRQTIHDQENHIDITTDFVKIPGGSHGGSWAARIKGTLREDAPQDLKTTVVYAVNLEGAGTLELENEVDPLGYEGTITFQGETEQHSRFKLEITEGPQTNNHPFVDHPSYQIKPLDRTILNGMPIPVEQTWHSKRTHRASYCWGLVD